MSKPLLVALTLLGVVGLPAVTAFAATDAECEKSFEAADTNRDGALTATEGRRYFAALRVANKPVAGDRMDKAAFIEHCKADVFTASQSQPAPGAPLEGANSFTEGQAKDRAEAAGFTEVSALQKDDKGIWRGTAKRGGSQVKIAIDFKGNVVAQ